MYPIGHGLFSLEPADGLHLLMPAAQLIAFEFTTIESLQVGRNARHPFSGRKPETVRNWEAVLVRTRLHHSAARGATRAVHRLDQLRLIFFPLSSARV